MNLILFDDSTRENLLPLTFTRPVCEIRIGILTIKEKWEKYLNTKASYFTAAYLSEKFSLNTEAKNLYVNGSVCPDADLVAAISKLKEAEVLTYKGKVVAYSSGKKVGCKSAEMSTLPKLEYPNSLTDINFPWDIFSKNGVELEKDFEIITKGRTSQPLSKTNQLLGNRIFLEEGAKAECCIFNTTTGPIYLGKNTEVMEGSVVRGGLALCEGAGLKLSTKIYGPTTIGPQSRVGGEVNNSVIIGFSNKGHDGFLGNSVIGEWCNLGADTNNSNLKNNYSEVKVWNYAKKDYIGTGLQFCGLIMGDHSKSGINTMFNTGTVVGVSVNIYGGDFPSKHIPSFSWGDSKHSEVYDLAKATETAERVMERRGVKLTETDKKIFRYLFEECKS